MGRVSLGKDLKNAFTFAYGALAGVPARDGKTHVSTVFVGEREEVICQTCQDTGMVGHPPYQIECSACIGHCRTCGGTGKLGKPGHQVDCLACQSTPRLEE